MKSSTFKKHETESEKENGNKDVKNSEMEKKRQHEPKYDYDEVMLEDMIGYSYLPPNADLLLDFPREKNPVVFLEISASGGRVLRDRSVSQFQIIGRLFFELRNDVCPIACANFMSLIAGSKGMGRDGILYHYKGIRIHRIIKNLLFESGDLDDACGNCSKSIYNNGGLFRDENFILRHAGPGCISYCNRGFDSNGSLFQVSFTQNSDLDGKYVVFGCLASPESFDCLSRINDYGTAHGAPLEELRIHNCGIAYPHGVY